MFKIRDIMVLNEITLGEKILSVIGGVLTFDNKAVPVISPLMTPGAILTIDNDGTLIPVSNVWKASIYINSSTGDDTTGTGSEASPFLTMDKAIEASSSLNMYTSVEFIFEGDVYISQSATLHFPLEVSFIGIGSSAQIFDFTKGTNVNTALIEFDSRCDIILQNVSVKATDRGTAFSSFFSGKVKTISFFDSDVLLYTSVALVETYYDISIKLVDSSILNNNQVAIYNMSHDFVWVSIDNNSQISESEFPYIVKHIRTGNKNIFMNMP